MSVEVVVLGSGSRGNATLVRSERVAILVDAGFSARQLERRLAAVGAAPGRLDAILLTHEHADHVAGVRVFSRRHEVPVLANAGTRAALGAAFDEVHEPRSFVTGAVFDIGPCRVVGFPVPHDAAEPVGFRLELEGVRVGIATDLGHVPDEVAQQLAGCDCCVLEANHDREMLLGGPYPWATKQRIASLEGHLSNDRAARALASIVTGATRRLILAHLSEINNDRALAESTVRRALRDAGSAAALTIAGQDRPAEPVRL